MQYYQQTLRHTVHTQGIGLHTGRSVDLALHPAPAGTGVRFLRADMRGTPPILARADSILDTRLATTIAAGAAFVSTIEHLMATLYAFGVDNVIVEVCGPEVPVFDGSAARFVTLIEEAGIRVLTAPRTYLRPVTTIAIHEGEKWVRLDPGQDGLRVDCTIDFDHPTIGRQHCAIEVTPGMFRSSIASARTFGFLRDLEALQASGLGLGGGLDNAVVLDDTRVINPEGLRFADEFARHKALDLIGDLALTGLPILGNVTSYKSGHALNARLTQHLVAHPECWEKMVPAVQERVAVAAF